MYLGVGVGGVSTHPLPYPPTGHTRPLDIPTHWTYPPTGHTHPLDIPTPWAYPPTGHTPWKGPGTRDIRPRKGYGTRDTDTPCGPTDTCENIIFSQLRSGAIMISDVTSLSVES